LLAVVQLSRTAPLPTLTDLAAAIDELRDLCERAGRARDAVSVQIESAASRVLLTGDSLVAHADLLHEMSEIGVGWFVIDTTANSVDESIDALHRYGDQVIDSFR